jgi:glycosyltransferase involved in cell wall biosynthesis
MSKLRVLLTNLSLCARSGTELYTRDVAAELLRRGHQPAVYSPLCGVVADEIRAAGVPVVDDLSQLEWSPDVIHGHHHPETMTALLAFPTAPALFVCHDREAWHDHPPRFPRLRRYVAVDENCRERFAADGVADPAAVAVIPNGVDLERFRARGPLPAQPTRALLFSNYAAEHTHLGQVRAACAAAGLTLDVIGSGVGNLCARPEEVLPGYDVVFAKARCALEALASGCAVVLCDDRGTGPLIRSASWEQLRRWNFGRRTCTQPLTADALRAELAGYDPNDAAEACRITRERAGLALTVDALVGLYHEVIAAHRAAPPADPAEELRAVADYLRNQRPYPELARLVRLHRECASLRQWAEQAQAGWERTQQGAEAAQAGWQACEAERQRLEAEVAALRAKPAGGLLRWLWPRAG